MIRKLLLLVFAASLFLQTSSANPELDAYFTQRSEEIATASLATIQSKAEWESHRGEARRQLAEMLGLDPFPERTPLETTVTGTLDGDGFTVEKLHFQPLPKFYVAANLYLPKQRAGKLPAILYVCGHGRSVENGVSNGNKTVYQHHAAWFARNGYVCLIVDTVQLGEFQGKHHGTYRLNRWDWPNRGYTPAGTEAWTGIRALDLLQARDEVDPTRIGVTGRSGGGAYSWWIAALDDRISCAVPVAGITTMKNHVIDGCIEGHCDCMYMVNTYHWDFAQLAALIAPRPLLISNSDKDSIFPLDGVVDIYQQTRRIYKLLNAEDRIGLNITEGPHKDTQDLRVPAFRWMNRWLKNDTGNISLSAEAQFEQKALRVFDALPADEITTRIEDTFVPAASGTALPANDKEWQAWKAQVGPYVSRLIQPDATPSPLFPPSKLIKDERVVPRSALVDFTNEKEFTQIRRRHQLLGTSIDADHAAALARLFAQGPPKQLHAEGAACFTLLLAVLASDTPPETIHLSALPDSFSPAPLTLQSPVFLGIQRQLTVTQLVALAREKTVVEITN